MDPEAAFTLHAVRRGSALTVQELSSFRRSNSQVSPAILNATVWNNAGQIRKINKARQIQISIKHQK